MARTLGTWPALCAALMGLASAGCRPNVRQELLEAQLRSREREVEELRGELETARVTSQAYQDETRRRGLGIGPGDPARPGLSGLAIAAGTGGIDDDRDGRDESLLVVLVPRDEGGNAVRAVGSATIVIREVGPTGVKTLLDTWDVSASELRRTWRGSLLSTGYSVPLAWRNPPMSERLRIEARFVAADGTAYEADREIRVRPPLSPVGAGVPVAPPSVIEGPAIPTPPRFDPSQP